MIKDPQWFCHHLVSETSNWITINQLVGYFNRVDQAVKIKLTSEKIIGREGGDVCTFIKCLIFMHFVTTCTCWKLPVLLHKPHSIFIEKNSSHLKHVLIVKKIYLKLIISVRSFLCTLLSEYHDSQSYYGTVRSDIDTEHGHTTLSSLLLHEI